MCIQRLLMAFALLALLLGGIFTAAPGAYAAAGWAQGAAMEAARVYHTATLLPDGTVLVAGGYTTPWAPLATAERYDPATGAWSPVASMNFGRLRHAAALLADGRVLVVGGQAYPDDGSATAEVYDPATNTWTPVAPMLGRREWPTATTLRDGRVLVADGASSTPRPESSGTAELYDPTTGGWAPAGTLTIERYAHSATLLPDGGVLVVGGMIPSHSPRCGSSRAFCATNAAERYDPATNTWIAVASTASPHGHSHTATLLPDGQVLVVGGYLSEQVAERYDPRAHRWAAAGAPPDTQFTNDAHTATLLPGGQVLIAGGGVPPTATTALYDAASDTWRTGPALATGRNRHTATRLRNGRVLVTGGGGSEGAVAFNSTEMYTGDSPTACFTETSFCIQGRFRDYWLANGGLDRNGFPLSDERVEVLEDGKAYTVQYFERVRMEYHPENAGTPYEVLLGQFGRRVYLGGSFSSAFPLEPVPPVEGQAYFPETGHNVDMRFYAYWQNNGGLAQFGYPIAEAVNETMYTAEEMLNIRVQYFERARFEFHPENSAPYDILLGQFGRQILAEVDLLAGNPDFAAIYASNERVRNLLHTPQEPALAVAGATQRFERGRMVYLERGGALPLLDMPDTGRWIYVFCGDGPSGVWLPYSDTWEEGQEPAGAGPRPGLYEPQRGFGKVWRENAAVRDCLGYATTPDEQGLKVAVQRFRRGFLLSTPAEDVVYALSYNTFMNGSVSGGTAYNRFPRPTR